jgi:hypothetical protein
MDMTERLQQSRSLKRDFHGAAFQISKLALRGRNIAAARLAKQAPARQLAVLGRGISQATCGFNG